jgi:hypothetical protein
MPLAGGAADKAGNRYELEWTVRQVLQVVVGSIDSIRIEPPGENAIEFRLKLGDRDSVHQSKRASKSGKWSSRELEPILADFLQYLTQSSSTTCVFVSQHSTYPLDELTDRCRAAANFTEFKQKFVTSGPLSVQLRRCTDFWQTEEDTAFLLLRRIRFETASLRTIEADNKSLIRALYSTNVEIVHAALLRLCLDSVHKVLDDSAVTAALSRSGIRRQGYRRDEPTPSAARVPPHPALIGRDVDLTTVETKLKRSGAVIVEGPPGIGKSAVAAGIANKLAEQSTIWLSADDYGLTDAITTMAYAVGLQGSSASLLQVADAIGGANALVVWDGLDGDHPLLQLVERFLERRTGGMHVVTRSHRASGYRLAGAEIHQLRPLTPSKTVEMFIRLAGSRPTGRLLNASGGVPKYIQIGSGSDIDHRDNKVGNGGVLG